jgi:hypothetical protein
MSDHDYRKELCGVDENGEHVAPDPNADSQPITKRPPKAVDPTHGGLYGTHGSNVKDAPGEHKANERDKRGYPVGHPSFSGSDS